MMQSREAKSIHHDLPTHTSRKVMVSVYLVMYLLYM